MAVVAWRLHANVSQNCIFLIRYYLFRVNRIAGRYSPRSLNKYVIVCVANNYNHYEEEEQITLCLGVLLCLRSGRHASLLNTAKPHPVHTRVNTQCPVAHHPLKVDAYAHARAAHGVHKTHVVAVSPPASPPAHDSTSPRRNATPLSRPNHQQTALPTTNPTPHLHHRHTSH